MDAPTRAKTHALLPAATSEGGRSQWSCVARLQRERSRAPLARMRTPVALQSRPARFRLSRRARFYSGIIPLPMDQSAVKFHDLPHCPRFFRGASHLSTSVRRDRMNENSTRSCPFVSASWWWARTPRWPNLSHVGVGPSVGLVMRTQRRIDGREDGIRDVCRDEDHRKCCNVPFFFAWAHHTKCTKISVRCRETKCAIHHIRSLGILVSISSAH